MTIEHRDSDEAIVHRVLLGHTVDFEVLIARYLPLVHTVIRARLASWSDIEDIAQEAFVAAYTSLDQLRNPKHFRAWLMAITRNACTAQRKNAQRRQALQDTLEKDMAPEEPMDMHRRELHGLLRQAVSQLDDSHREVLFLYYFSGKSLGGLEKTLELSHEAAKKRLQRARHALEAYLAENLDDAFEAYIPHRHTPKRIASALLVLQPTWLPNKGGAAPLASSVPAGGGGTMIAAKITAGLVAALALAGATMMWPREKTAETVVSQPSPECVADTSMLRVAASDAPEGVSTAGHSSTREVLASA